MARWEPDARGRLEKAAMDLFEEHGYETTTVEEIATRAGLTAHIRAALVPRAFPSVVQVR